uniref:Tetratricopeptide repeat protein 9C n=2 Tax=Canis lupus familiaris TaxID=9615 RepID=A0A8P0P5Z8_CANLF|nr:tetratricopeptide repeat protein 9C isoform X1 [Vulpes vulpes]XP_025860441.1 tetratricopeptide repeat protein 9C isoform X1 [Vulpes vulpes]XP_025860442.1 tetratricopeptide repeat protein 9C isoform X1 [Vulpes vulpes]|eukprot:XP_022261490.1 tetratricopeptide repeat protein 9C isoform X1 [Canis lupus familiaris]
MEKRLQEAQLYKEEGNQRYREGKYRDAVSRYHRALLQLRGLDPSLPSPIPNIGPQGPALTPEQEKILHTTQTDCYNNLAACLLQMEPVNYERVKEYSQKVLERQPNNAKALYRAGVAFFHLQDYDQAQHYLQAAVNRQPKGKHHCIPSRSIYASTGACIISPPSPSERDFKSLFFKFRFRDCN